MPGLVRKHFGLLESGAIAELYSLENSNGMKVCLTNYGATLTEITVPVNNKRVNVLLGFDNLEAYLNPHPYLGNIVGRFANRVGGACFQLNGETFKLYKNDNENSLHGGKKGFDKQLWKVESVEDSEEPTIDLSYTSPHLDEGYPGELYTKVSYQVSKNNELRIKLFATTDKATPVNLTSHGYFNLKGAGNGDILDHLITVKASHYTPVDKNLIPTGEIATVEGTLFDLQEPTTLRKTVFEIPPGIDHNFVIDGKQEQLKLAAILEEPNSHLVMEVHTSQPGIQVYTGNFLDGTLSGNGGSYHKHYGICLETQHFPDSVNKPHFPKTILEPGEEYRHTIIYKFKQTS